MSILYFLLLSVHDRAPEKRNVLYPKATGKQPQKKPGKYIRKYHGIHKAACLSHKGPVLFDPNLINTTARQTGQKVQYRINIPKQKYQKQTKIGRGSIR